MTLHEWESQGQYVEANGHRLFVVDQGQHDKTLVILHGYPSCSFDYHRVLSSLTQHYRVIIHDHPGYGLSNKPLDYSYSLIEQADTALALWQQLGVKEAHMLGHDYGTSVVTEILAQREKGFEPVKLQSVTLCNGSIHIELADLRVIQRLLLHPVTGPIVAQLSSPFIFKRNMRNLWADKSKVTDEELNVLWELLVRDNGRKVLPKLTQYIAERRKYWHRWIGALERLDLPTLILWGDKDPVAVSAIAEKLHEEIPKSTLQWLANVGHYPMLEVPEEWSSAVLVFLETGK